ncbi:MAG: hypothetical protein KDB72_04775 [Mycobacterium sp.]|nr:hypothetical protein [Mycobacterium sp.]
MNAKMMLTAAIAVPMAALGLAGTAGAAPSGGSNAQDTINRLTAQGYSVQINHNGGWSDIEMSRCIVSGVHGLYPDVAQGQLIPAGRSTTAYVDVACSTTE